MSNADVVGPDRTAPPLDEDQLRSGVAGMWDRTWLNIRTGNLGPIPIIVGLLVVIVLFKYTATNFFTAVNFVNLINESAGTAMLAFGVVFVLLLGEIDLSIGYLAGIGALVVAELQLPGSAWHLPSVWYIPGGILAMLLAVSACAAIGGVQGSIVAFVGVPSFVVTLGGFLIWQGVILNTLEQRGTIIIQDRWINYTDSYGFSPSAGWLIAAIFTALYPAQRRHQVGVRTRHADRARQHLGVPRAGDRHRHRRLRDRCDREPRARSSRRRSGCRSPASSSCSSSSC